MFLPADPYDMDCPSREMLDLIGGKWAILILCRRQQGPVRTGALQRAIGGISQKMLTQTLRTLERDGFVERIGHPEVPPRVEYRLTDLGRSLSALARAMEQWVVAHYPAFRSNGVGSRATAEPDRIRARPFRRRRQPASPDRYSSPNTTLRAHAHANDERLGGRTRLARTAVH